MKTRYILIIFVLVLVLCGCVKTQETHDNSDNSNGYTDLDGQRNLSTDEKGITIESDIVYPPLSTFFYQIGTHKEMYTSEFLFYADEVLPNKIDLIINEVDVLEQGVLCHIRIDCDIEFPARDCMGWDRFDLGYFYVRSDKIYLIRNYSISDHTTELDLMENGTIICQSDAIPDALDSDEKGWHEYIEEFE